MSNYSPIVRYKPNLEILDFQQGSWTPNSYAAINWSSPDCGYIKFGQLVHLYFQAAISTNSDTNVNQIFQLPFKPDFSVNNNQFGYGVLTGASSNYFIRMVDNGASEDYMQFVTNSFGNLTWSNLSGRTMRGTITYPTLS